MGSSKKHKEKRDRKKHKRERSRSRDREGHKKSHKSSHRREKRRSPEHDDFSLEIQVSDINKSQISSVVEVEQQVEIQESQKRTREVVSDDEFDVEKLLDSKLSENADFASALKHTSKRRRREGALEQLRKRQNLDTNEDSLERFATEQLLEEHGIPDTVSDKKHYSPQSKNKSSDVHSHLGFKIKEEPYEEESLNEEQNETQRTLTIGETNKLRAKLGLRLLDVKIETAVRNDDTQSSIEANKLREKLGLKTVECIDDKPEYNEPQLSLSIVETNKLRAKLGLKPLDIGTEIPGFDASAEKEISKPAAEVFVKTENISEKKKSEALREKFRVTKEKRAIEEKLKKTKGIADSDSEDESAADWVIKHQKILQEKEQAEKRAKLLEEMDAEFGVSALVEEEFDKKNAYTSQHLKGLTIAHDMDAFQ